MDSKKTGQFIRKKRTEKNMTQKQLSEKMHVTVSAISQYENGKRIPDISVMEILCENLDISLTELIHGEEMQEQDEKEIREIIHFSRQIVTETKRKAAVLILIILLCSVIVLTASSRKSYSLKEGSSTFGRTYYITESDSDYIILPQIRFLTMNNTFEIITRSNIDTITLEGTYIQKGNDIYCTTKSLQNTYHFQLVSEEEIVFLEDGSDYDFDIDAYDDCTFKLENYTSAKQYSIPAEKKAANTFQEVLYAPHIHPYMTGYLADFGFYRVLTDGEMESYQIRCLSCEKGIWTDSIILEEPIRGHSIDLGIHLEDHIYHFYRFDPFTNTTKEVTGMYSGYDHSASNALHAHDITLSENMNSFPYIIYKHVPENVFLEENITETDCDYALIFTITLLPKA